MTTISLNGHPTWARVPKKKGVTVVLLHGGMSSSHSLLRSIGPGLSKSFQLAAFDRRGHGRTRDTDAEFHYDDMTSETIAFLEHLGRRSHLIGHSDGGIIALQVAMRRPDLVRRVVAVGANYHFNGLVPMDEFDTNSDGYEQWAEKYASMSPDGIGHAGVVIAKTMRMFATEPVMTTRELSAITRPVLVMSGDDDVVTLEHTCSLYQALPDAQLAVLPGTSHALLKERTRESVRVIRHFLQSELPVTTFQPVRRRQSPPSA
ncbi:MAG: alpha/beta fold hydrolase [Acidimicrobiales bacterium]